jgi:hypothetical protein
MISAPAGSLEMVVRTSAICRERLPAHSQPESRHLRGPHRPAPGFFLDKDQFRLRIRAVKERLGRLEEQPQCQADRAMQRRELLLIITRLEDFTARIKDGLHTPTGTRNEISSAHLFDA